MDNCSIEVGNSVNIKRSDGECFDEKVEERKGRSGASDNLVEKKTGSAIRTAIISQAISSARSKVSHCDAH